MERIEPAEPSERIERAEAMDPTEHQDVAGARVTVGR
jgi:hypothetical protein